MNQRVSFYIDGYNFYCGLCEKHGRKWLWLDYGQLCRTFLQSGQSLAAIRYCTAPVRGGVDKTSRQESYWKALRTVPGLSIHLGYHQKNNKVCQKCGKVISRYEEKQTDSRIASLIVADALLDRTDVLIVMAGDSDHVPAIQMVKEERPQKTVLVCSPPMRKSNELCAAADATLYVSEKRLRKSQFPETVRLADGSSVTRPAKWR